MKKYLCFGALIGFCVSTMIYLSTSYFYEDIILYVFNVRNGDEINFMSEKEGLIKLFIKDLEDVDENTSGKIDSLAEKHFFNQFSKYKILKYPIDDDKLEMILIPVDEETGIIYVYNYDIYSYINIRFNLK